MKKLPTSALGKMYETNIKLLLEKNIEALLDQYTDDALIISSFTGKPVTYRGRDGIRGYLEGMLGIDGFDSEIIFWGETDSPQTAMFTEQVTMKTGGGEIHMRLSNSWALRDGKIAIHFAGVVQRPDGSVA